MAYPFTIASTDSHNVTFGFEGHKTGVNNPIYPVVRGPIAFKSQTKDYAPNNKNTWGVYIDTRTGDDPGTVEEVLTSGGLRINSTSQKGFEGIVRGVEINSTLGDGHAPTASSTGLKVTSTVTDAQSGPGDWWNMGIVVVARGEAKLPSSQSGDQIGIEGHVYAYLDDDRFGKGSRQVYAAKCHNLDLDNVLGPATFGAAFRAVHMIDGTMSGINWFKKAFHADGRDGVNGGIIDGAVLEDIKDRSVHIVRTGAYGVDIDLTPSPYAGVATANAIRVSGGDTKSSVIRAVLETVSARISIGSRHRKVGHRIGQLEVLGENSAGDELVLSEIFAQGNDYTAGKETVSVVVGVRRQGKLRPAVRIDDKVNSLGALNAAGGAIEVNGTKVLGPQEAAVADATDEASAVKQLNELLSRLRRHGLIAT